MEQSKGKDFKTKAKEAMKRMKSGFWENYREEVKVMAEKAKSDGVDTSKVVEFYETKNSHTIIKETDDFYKKVKFILDTEGEVSDIIGRLIDNEYYKSLDYDHRQRYVLEISRKYRDALERYKREEFFNKKSIN